jgi:hypothetical protein
MLDSISSFFTSNTEQSKEIKSKDSIGNFTLRISRDFVESFDPSKNDRKNDITELINQEVRKKVEAKEKEMELEIKKVKEDALSEIEKVKQKGSESVESFDTVTLIKKTENLITQINERPEINVTAIDLLHKIECCYKENPQKTLLCRELVNQLKVSKI